MTDYLQEQEMEIEALEAILMDEFREIDSSESGLNTSNRCFQIVLCPQDDNFDEASQVPVQLALVFSHTEEYPDKPPLLNVKSIKGIRPEDLALLKENLENEAKENLGMAMMYTLATSAKEWLTEKFCSDAVEEPVETEKQEDEVIVPHGEAVTVESFLAWRERFEAELALERAKLMPESALTAPKEKRLTGRQYFESGRHSTKGATLVAEGSEEEEEDIDFDEDFEDDDEEDMLEHYLAEKSAEGSIK
ncbi:ubiquitin-conjugating enzyme family protein [Carex rostrata]